MPFWHRATPEEQGAKEEQKRQALEVTNLAARQRQDEIQRQQTDQERMARGLIPIQAERRLSEMRDQAPPFFTSDLSPDEAALLRRHGFRPLGLVAGSAMYHVGTPFAAPYDCEVPVLSQAYNTATHLALDRMRQELQLLGAHGVVGVRYDIMRHEWAEGTVEVQVVGTAVGGPGAAPAHPWMSDLSGQEWFALHRAGYEAAGLVYGNCTWFIFTTQADRMLAFNWQNVEIAHVSNALGQARQRANSHIEQLARQTGATGVVGVQVSRRMDEVLLQGYEGEHHNLVLSLIGTAIKLRADAPRAIAATLPIISLRDGRMTPALVHQADATFE